jgi:GTPase SAR1 family protein
MPKSPMSQLSLKSTSTGEERTVRILVAGDKDVGKSTLLLSLMTEKFPEGGVPAVLPEVSIPSKYNPDNVNVLLIDSSAETSKISEDIDSIILVYDASDVTSNLERLRGYWLPLISSYNAAIPIILAGTEFYY